MAFIRGGDLTVTLVRPSGAQQPLTLFSNNVSLSMQADMVETSVLSDQVRDYQPTMRSASITVSGFFDDTLVAPAAGLDYQLETMLNNGELVNWSIVFGTGTTRTWRNSGFSTGSPSTANGARVASFERSNEVGGIAAFSITLECSGIFEVV